MEVIKASAIYADIIARNGINEVDKDSYVRNLRNKMAFIVEHIALRKISDFKNGNSIMIPVNDAPIVRNLIMAALDEENFPCVVDWFNGAFDIADAYNCILLFARLYEVIMQVKISSETDSITIDEWLARIKGILNVDLAPNIIKMKHQLEEFKARTFARKNTVSLENAIAAGNKLLPETLLSQITENLSFQNDYFRVLSQIIDYMIKDAEKKAITDSEAYANLSANNKTGSMVS